MNEILSQPIPWYIAGLLIGLTLPVLLIIGNKTFGVSSSFRHMCAAVFPNKFSYFNYDWKKEGAWNLKLIAGITIGGIIASLFTSEGYQVNISPDTVAHLQSIGFTNFSGLVPQEIFSISGPVKPAILGILIFGGFLIGFGTRYAGGCTSGHAITGLATLQKASLIAVIGFFVGGLITTYFILPYILG